MTVDLDRLEQLAKAALEVDDWSPIPAADVLALIQQIKGLQQIVALWHEAARDESLSAGAFRALIATWSFEPITEADIARTLDLFPELKARGPAQAAEEQGQEPV